MKRRWTMVGILLTVLLLCLTGWTGQAQETGPQGEAQIEALVGTAFTYQGLLKRDGALVNGTCDLRFSLWDAVSGGTQIGTTQTKSGITVSHGLFTIRDLDFGVGAFPGEARWLAIAVRCPSGSGTFIDLSPRQPLTAAPYALALPGLWTQPNTTSPNLIGGYSGNILLDGVVGATIGGGGASGSRNGVTDDYGTVSGGRRNRAGDGAGTTSDQVDATVGGGYGNMASGQAATVSGGLGNRASGPYAAVGGGQANTASGESAVIGGGSYNTASGDFATIAGGGPSDPAYPDTSNNRVWDHYGVIGGGGFNRAGSDDGNPASARYATVSGGQSNTASGEEATVSGGHYNTASGDNATIGGGDNNTAGGKEATIGGGAYNVASNWFATVGGGNHNVATGMQATVGGGSENIASGLAAAIGGGVANAASGYGGTIGGGGYNTASEHMATVAGGYTNQATGQYATVGGGSSNTASGNNAMVPGGTDNVAAGNYSFAAGRRAKANNLGCFVWGDATNADVACNNNNRWVARASGGVWFYTNAGLTSGVYVASGSNGWLGVSDRAMKENLAPADTRAILEKLASLPVVEYNLKSQDPSVRHIGMVAQDFATFGYGESDKAINTQDADGVMMAAIQALYAENQSLKAENAAQQAQIDALLARIAALEGRKHPLGLALAGGVFLLGLGVIWASQHRQ